MNTKNIVWILVVVLVVLGIGIWLYSIPGPSESPSPTTNTVTPEPAAPPSTVEIPTTSNTPDGEPSVSEKSFTITGQDYSFSQAALRVNKGDKVTITFKNVEGMHDFKLDEFRVATKKIREGQEDTVTFIADKIGSFEYYCSIGSHRALGMKGTLTVQ